MSIDKPLISISEVTELSGVHRKTLLIWSADGRFPKPLKRKKAKDPYHWRRHDVEEWLMPKNTSSAISEERIRELIKSELIAILRSTSPVGIR